MTEDQAKTKWCPFVTQSTLLGEPFQGSPQCIASKCMAWRWDSDFNEIMDRVPRPDDPRAVADGHCGLAGKP